MGAWEELDTEINCENDHTDLEKILSLDDPYGILEPVQNEVNDLINKIDTGSKNAVEDLAKRNVSFQEKWINKNCKNPSGVLASSIDYEGNDYSYITGTRINHIYPMSVEYGHIDIYPVHAQALAFYSDNGELIFSKHVRSTPPRPFVAPAYDDTVEIAETIMLTEIEHAGVDWD